MAQYTNRNDLMIKFAQGKGYFYQAKPTTTGSLTTSNANSGAFTVGSQFNTLGTTTPGTLVGFPTPTGPSADISILMSGFSADVNAARGAYLAYFYKMGTINLAATGNQFTPDAATFPITRTQFGAATKPLTLLPLLYTTAALTVTAAAFQLQTSGGAAGYTNQSGSAVIGAKTFTYPSASATATSGFFLRLEDGDSGVQAINQVNVTTASTTGTATIYGIELIAPMGCLHLSMVSMYDGAFGGIGLQSLTPGIATSGTATSMLGSIILSSTGSVQGIMTIAGVLNN